MKSGLFLIMFLSSGLFNLYAQKKSVVEINGRLSVKGTHLVNEAGVPIQLRGLGSHGLQWFWNCYKDGLAIKSMGEKWGADIFRIALYVREEGYLSNKFITKENFRARVDSLVDDCEAAGIYCIIDWHVHLPGDPNIDLNAALEFWDIMSKKHAGKKHVIYEIANEPNDDDEFKKFNKTVDWPVIKTYAEKVIATIRKNDTSTVILVGTPHWSSLGLHKGLKWESIEQNRLTDPKVMYVFHFYAAHIHHEVQFAAAAKKLPLFVTEWGASGWQSDSKNNLDSARRMLQIMRENKVSWCFFNWSDKDEVMAFFIPKTCTPGQTFDPLGTRLTESGILAHQFLNIPADSFGVTPVSIQNKIAIPSTLHKPIRKISATSKALPQKLHDNKNNKPEFYNVQGEKVGQSSPKN